METLEVLQKELGGQVKTGEMLGRFTTLKIGGPADYFFDAKTTDDLVRAITIGRKLGIPVTLLGGGTNILIGDKGIRGLVIKNSTGAITMRGAKGTVSGGVTKKRRCLCRG